MATMFYGKIIIQNCTWEVTKTFNGLIECDMQLENVIELFPTNIFGTIEWWIRIALKEF